MSDTLFVLEFTSDFDNKRKKGFEVEVDDFKYDPVTLCILTVRVTNIWKRPTWISSRWFVEGAIMNTITRISTARNTAFIVGHPKDGAQDSPKITQIEYLAGETQASSSYGVTFSDGTFIEVFDVVESWRTS